MSESEINRRSFLKIGDNKLSMNRRELTMGIFTSLLFGLSHETLEIFNARRLPVFTAVAGFGLWYMQRKFGFLSNLALHMTRNIKY